MSLVPLDSPPREFGEEDLQLPSMPETFEVARELHKSMALLLLTKESAPDLGSLVPRKCPLPSKRKLL